MSKGVAINFEKKAITDIDFLYRNSGISNNIDGLHGEFFPER